MRKQLYYVILITMIDCQVKAQCNGFESLCLKNYNEIAYLTTHNSYNSFEDSFYLPNQNLNITSQLNHGVRAFMLDIYSLNNELVLYHNIIDLGYYLFSDVLLEFKNFIEQNPNEVITIILEDYSTINELTTELETSLIIDYLYVHNVDMGWPTLQEIINVDKRIVLFSDQDIEEAPIWFNYLWDHAVETNYDNLSIEDFSCDYNRGQPENELFILNHFITDYFLYVTNIEVYNEQVQVVNTNPYFLNRANECKIINDKFPNFITVDFFDNGDCIQVVNTLNNVNELSLYNALLVQNIFPNPAQDIIQINIENFKYIPPIRMYNLLGIEISDQIDVFKTKQEIIIQVSTLKTGLYFLHYGEHSVPVIIE